MEILARTIIKWISKSVLLMVRCRSTVERIIWVQKILRQCDITEISDSTLCLLNV